MESFYSISSVVEERLRESLRSKDGQIRVLMNENVKLFSVLKRMKEELDDKNREIKYLSDHNSELAKLLSDEEDISARLKGAVNSLRLLLKDFRRNRSRG